MSLLVGEYECTLDAKNRLMIPADFRNELKEAEQGPRWYLFLHMNNRLWLMPEAEFKRQVSKIRPSLLPKDEQLDFVRKLFGNARLLDPDKTGRVVLPEKLIGKAGLERAVTLVGMGRYVEIFNRQAWLEEDAKDDHDDRFRRAREAGIELGE